MNDFAYRIELWATKWKSLADRSAAGQVKQTYVRLPIYPKTHYVMTPEMRERAMASILAELECGVRNSKGRQAGRAQRLHQRTMFDLK